MKKKVLALLLLVSIIGSGIPMNANAAGFEIWWPNARALEMGETKHVYEYVYYQRYGSTHRGGVFSFYVPATMNITLNVVSDTSMPLSRVNLYDANGKSVYSVNRNFASEWKINPVAKTTYLAKTTTLSPGYYYIECDTFYMDQPSFTIGVNGSLAIKPVILKAKRKRNTSGVVKWNRGNSITGYQIFRAKQKKGNYKYIQTVAGNSSKFKDYNLKKRKKYFYKVRAYVNINGKTYYSEFSSVKKLK